MTVVRLEQPYHEGEKWVQATTGEQRPAAANGRIIADAVVPGARRLIVHQHLLVASSLDAAGRPWSSVVLGRPGFLDVPDPQVVTVDLTAVVPTPTDPLWTNLRGRPEIGLLFIDLATRVRYRVNGRVTSEPARLRIEVREAYPNCPQYVQRRSARLSGADGDGDHGADLRAGRRLGAAERELVRRADTVFVASGHPDGRLDASHRGGHVGFVQVVDATTLRVPDYPGNSMFNTLGNLVLNPVAGLTFVDFDAGRVLQATGSTALHLDGELPDHTAGGTGRYWTLSLDEWRSHRLPATIAFEYLDASPYNPPPAASTSGTTSGEPPGPLGPGDDAGTTGVTCALDGAATGRTLARMWTTGGRLFGITMEDGVLRWYTGVGDLCGDDTGFAEQTPATYRRDGAPAAVGALPDDVAAAVAAVVGPPDRGGRP